jgi:hypothetical protein
MDRQILGGNVLDPVVVVEEPLPLGVPGGEGVKMRSQGRPNCTLT